MAEEDSTSVKGDNHNAAVASDNNDDNVDDNDQEEEGPPTCGVESVAWILWGAFCAILGWVFTDKLSIDDIDIPTQQLLNGEFVRDLTFDEYFDHNDTVSTIATYLIAGLVPIILQSALAYKWGPRRDLHYTVLAYLVTFGTSLLASEPVKWYVSYRRPNFYQVCQPNDDYTECLGFEGSSGEHANNANYNNKEDGSDEYEEIVNAREAIFSFPSGHSSTAFAGLMFFALYLHHRFGMPAWHRARQRRKRLRQQQQQGNTDGNAANDNGKVITTTTSQEDAQESAPSSVALVVAGHRCISMFGFILPMAVAVFIAVSRIVDSRHFPADVIAGSLIGVASAVWVHPLWYYYDIDEAVYQ